MESAHKLVSGEDTRITVEGLGKEHEGRKGVKHWQCRHYTFFEHLGGVS